MSAISFELCQFGCITSVINSGIPTRLIHSGCERVVARNAQLQHNLQGTKDPLSPLSYSCIRFQKHIIHLISLVEWSLSFIYVLERIKDFFCVYFGDVSILK